MNKQKFIGNQRLRRKRHVRNKVRGDSETPRLSVIRSHKNVACQLIDDEKGVTIVAASTQEKALDVSYGGNCEAAKVVGKAVAERALEAGIKKVRFDRGHLKYHGRVAALADAAREAGLEF